MPLDGVKNIVLVLSGKGGVGKSSVTLQLALALSLHGKSVGILDIDLTGPSIPRLVGLEDAKITQSPTGWLPVPVHEAVVAQNDDEPSSEKKTRARGSLRCMSLGFLLRDRGDAVIWRGPKKTAMIRQFLSDVAWGPTDYLLVDTPPGTSDEHIALAEQLLTLSTTDAAVATQMNLPRLQGAVLVTTPQAVATSDVRKEANFCVGGGEVMAQELNIPFMGRVPVDVKFGELVEGNLEVETDDEDDDEDNLKDGGEKTAQKASPAEPDTRPLVEKYQEGWSYTRFEEFARTIIASA
ncbi:Cytosolic Fe-S cluster assembly factor cfd1 [Penicillium diatomitis]|uniref:Cytosolic Fe-S cluster assembly factor cfd1 n=1 Tax=Penicillium diatomitis TaxID=2819901 RepID=A0A9W9XLN3_9EURO|nr:Cytosolic Fe-S cluster assembly factor cfd1 [Penicillium diatomitis]KAJ5495252.1 Cytosolic Fe-S cluster assembly factor cfd1 [Penicillium diatomitis]